MSKNFETPFNDAISCMIIEDYETAIKKFNTLIDENSKFSGDKDVDILLSACLNNIGYAKCALAQKNRDMNLYREGIKYFEKSINIPSLQDEKRYLIGFHNFNISVNAIKDWPLGKPQHLTLFNHLFKKN